MSKIIFAGDLHLSPRVPASRKDDYPETLLNKLDSLRQLAIQKDVSDIVFLGDLFNTKHMTLAYFIKCFQKFKAIDDQGIVLHTCIGNHDITYDNDSTLEESAIKLLFDSGVLDTKSVFTRDNVSVYLYNFTQLTSELPKPTNLGQYNVLVGHYFYLTGFNDIEHTLSPQQCEQLSYNAYVLGHDHTPYTPVIQKDYQVHRPGSLSRGTSQTCQVQRDEINVVLLDTQSHQFTYEHLPNVLPSKDVYREANLIDKYTLSSISESLQDLLKDLTFNNSSDIFETLHQIPMDTKVKELIISYLNNEGIYDNRMEEQQ